MDAAHLGVVHNHVDHRVSLVRLLAVQRALDRMRASAAQPSDVRMNAGKLRKRIVIEGVTETTDSFGSVIETWSPLGTRWGSVDPLTGSESVVAQQTQAVANRLIVLRHDSVTAQITRKSRLRIGARLFDIEDIQNPESRDEQLHVIARELVP